ncbi:MAG: aminotransferase class I/II-fold pyridoxal phosphate-dependent enzyme, partial [Devosia sp.]
MTAVSADGLQPFYAMEINAMARDLEAAGRDICHLEVGEPAAAPAPKVRGAVRAVLDAPQLYTHFAGLRDLREALAAYYAEQHSVSVDADSIVVTMGSSSGFILAFSGGFAPGAKIAVTRPGYPAYLNTLDG